jgi:hypothetical protein
LNKLQIRNSKAFSISLVFFVIILTLEILYRPFITRSNIRDFGFAGSFTNIFSVPAAAFFFLSISRSQRLLSLYQIASIALGFACYELFQLSKIIGTFDINDLIGIVLGMLITIFIQKLST